MGDAHLYAHMYPVAYINACILTSYMKTDNVTIDNLVYVSQNFCLYWFTRSCLTPFEIECRVGAKSIHVSLEHCGERKRYEKFKFNHMAAAVTLIRELKSLQKGFILT